VLGSPAEGGPGESQQVTPWAVKEPSVNTQAQAMVFLVVDRHAKYALVEGLTKS